MPRRTGVGGGDEIVDVDGMGQTVSLAVSKDKDFQFYPVGTLRYVHQLSHVPRWVDIPKTGRVCVKGVTC